MTKKNTIIYAIFSFFLCFGAGQTTYSSDFLNDIEDADRKVILAQYDAAKEIYQNVINAAEPSIVKSYAHYKLGSLYTRQEKTKLAKREYEKGLASLKKAGKGNHQIGNFLTQALNR